MDGIRCEHVIEIAIRCGSIDDSGTQTFRQAREVNVLVVQEARTVVLKTIGRKYSSLKIASKLLRLDRLTSIRMTLPLFSGKPMLG